MKEFLSLFQRLDICSYSPGSHLFEALHIYIYSAFPLLLPLFCCRVGLVTSTVAGEISKKLERKMEAIVHGSWMTEN